MNDEVEDPVLLQEGLLHATDAVIEDAVSYADPMMLRGLLYQLTGDEEVVETKEEKIGDIPAITKRLIEHVDNSQCPEIKVDIQLPP